MKNHLQAYRFSEEEINKMIELKGIFEKNDFKIDQFPEVYYDDYDNYLEIYNKEREKNQSSEEKKLYNLFSDYDNIRGIKIGNESIIDLLGVYTDFQVIGANVNTKEGVIVLFKDRIESLKLNHDHVRFVVLMHELGHWLTHWATYNNENWSKGYKAGSDKKTHESLAQLIAYWAVKGNSEFEKTLDILTPIDEDDPYALYKKLIRFTESTILKKLIEIRENPGCSDDIMYDFLESQTLCDSKLNKHDAKINNMESLDLKFLKKQLDKLDFSDKSTVRNFPYWILDYFIKNPLKENSAIFPSKEYTDAKYKKFIEDNSGQKMKRFIP